jgi:integrase
MLPPVFRQISPANKGGPEMAVRKRGKTWVIDYRVNGKRVVKAVGPQKRDAVAAEGKIKAQLREGRFFECNLQKRIPLGDLIEKYLSHIRPKRSGSTEAIHLSVIFNYFGAGKVIQEISRADIDAFRRARIDTPTRYGKPRSASTVNRELEVLRMLLNKALAWELILRNPAAGMEALPESNGYKRFLSVDEAGRLLCKCSLHLRPIVLCALETGMRRGEILGLRWQDIDFERRLIYVGKTKTGLSRYVPISSRLHKDLSKQPRRLGCEFVFVGESKIGIVDKPFHDVRTSFANACRRAGIENFRFHDLRHTAASHMVMAGVPLKTVAEILGHTTTAMTERYAHLLPEHKLRAVEMLPDWGYSHGD